MDQAGKSHGRESVKVRVVRLRYERIWHPYNPEIDATQLRDQNFTGESVVETRILFNRFETAVIGGALWVREMWFERVAYPVMRIGCLFGRHSIACRGRSGHYPGRSA